VNAPVIETTQDDRPRFVVAVNAGERMDTDDAAWFELLDRWREVEFAAAKEQHKPSTPWSGLAGWLGQRRPSTTVYQTGSMVVAVTITMALSRPVISSNAASVHLNRGPVAALIAQPALDRGVEIRGIGRERYGVLPDDALSPANGSRGREVADWDF
jgi:hypothetical protein